MYVPVVQNDKRNAGRLRSESIFAREVQGEMQRNMFRHTRREIFCSLKDARIYLEVSMGTPCQTQDRRDLQYATKERKSQMRTECKSQMVTTKIH